MSDDTPHHEKLEWCENCHANVEPNVSVVGFECPLCGNGLTGGSR